MTGTGSNTVDGSVCLAFAGCGRPLHVWLAAETDPAELQRAIGIFMPRWPVAQVAGDAVPDIAVTWTGDAYRIQATSWPGGESRAEDSHNAANALAGLLIDGLLAHQMATHCLHASASEMDGRAVLFAGPAEAGKSTLALRLAIRGCRHLADDRMLLTTDAPPHRVMALGLAAKARTPLAPGRGLQALVDRCWFLTDETISYLHLDEAETVPFGVEFPLGALVVPQRDPGFDRDVELRPARAGEVARTLIEETTSPAGPGVIVPAMTRLADAVDGFILTYRDGDAAADALVSAFGG